MVDPKVKPFPWSKYASGSNGIRLHIAACRVLSTDQTSISLASTFKWCNSFFLPCPFSADIFWPAHPCIIRSYLSLSQSYITDLSAISTARSLTHFLSLHYTDQMQQSFLPTPWDYKSLQCPPLSLSQHTQSNIHAFQPIISSFLSPSSVFSFSVIDGLSSRR